MPVPARRFLNACILVMIAHTAFAQGSFPPNADFATDDLSAFATWAKTGTINLAWDSETGSGAPGSLHATASGGSHAEAGLFLVCPSTLVGGKELEVHVQAKMKNVGADGNNVVAVAFWYPGSNGISPVWQHAGVCEGLDDEWVDCKKAGGPLKKMVEPAANFTDMRITFYLLAHPDDETPREMWIDDVQLIADGVPLTSSDPTSLLQPFATRANAEPVRLVPVRNRAAFALSGRLMGSALRITRAHAPQTLLLRADSDLRAARIVPMQ